MHLAVWGIKLCVELSEGIHNDHEYQYSTSKTIVKIHLLPHHSRAVIVHASS
jgi:hypothetical protein